MDSIESAMFGFLCFVTFIVAFEANKNLFIGEMNFMQKVALYIYAVVIFIMTAFPPFSLKSPTGLNILSQYSFIFLVPTINGDIFSSIDTHRLYAQYIGASLIAIALVLANRKKA